jgi:hypothetical protein
MENTYCCWIKNGETCDKIVLLLPTDRNAPLCEIHKEPRPEQIDYVKRIEKKKSFGIYKYNHIYECDELYEYDKLY